MRKLRAKYVGWIALLAAMLCIGALGAIRENHFQSDVGWASSYEFGMEQSRQSHKPILLSLRTPGCEWCNKMQAETFTDAKVIELSRRFVCVRLDSEIDAAIVGKYRVHEFPMTLIADERGRELARLGGYIAPDRFARVLVTAADSLLEEKR